MEESDPFWSVQLTGEPNGRPEAREALLEYQDHALPAGAHITEQSLAGVLGCEREVSIPLGTVVSCDDDSCRSRSTTAGVDRPSNDMEGTDSDTATSVGSLERASSLLVLKLRQVNGDGVMSGVGGDVWCAALLLSAWILQAPEALQGLDVLELGSGLGLCGIAAGYLAKSVTLTDYVDELLINLHHNVKINCTPRVEVLKRSPETFEDPSAAAAAGCEGTGRERQRHKNHRRLVLRPLSQDRVCVRKLDWTEYEYDNADAGAAGTRDSRNGRCGEVGWWWEDRGGPIDISGSESIGTARPDEATGILQCDVIIGSALVYNPRHACVADVLARSFRWGGCRMAHIVQLSTRPGFDDFLHRLGSHGLQYRLQKMSDALPGELLQEIRRRTPVTVVGGPVAGFCALGGDAAARGDECYRNDSRAENEGSNGDRGFGVATKVVAPAGAGGGGFDEFVLCSVFASSGQEQEQN